MPCNRNFLSQILFLLWVSRSQGQPPALTTCDNVYYQFVLHGLPTLSVCITYDLLNNPFFIDNQPFPYGLPTFLLDYQPFHSDCTDFPCVLPVLSLWFAIPFPMDYQTFPCGLPTLPYGLPTSPFRLDYQPFPSGLPTLSLCITNPFTVDYESFLSGSPTSTYGLQTLSLYTTNLSVRITNPFPVLKKQICNKMKKHPLTVQPTQSTVKTISNGVDAMWFHPSALEVGACERRWGGASVGQADRFCRLILGSGLRLWRILQFGSEQIVGKDIVVSRDGESDFASIHYCRCGEEVVYFPRHFTKICRYGRTSIDHCRFLAARNAGPTGGGAAKRFTCRCIPNTQFSMALSFFTSVAARYKPTPDRLSRLTQPLRSPAQAGINVIEAEDPLTHGISAKYHGLANQVAMFAALYAVRVLRWTSFG